VTEDEKNKITEIIETSQLTERKKELIKMHYGIGAEKCHTVEELARHFNVSPFRINEVLNKALHILRYPNRKRRLKDYLDK
jgi:RNA polymerase primary sigma factor